MTYQNPTPNYDNADADESSSLFLTVADASPPSSAFGPAGVATTKKKNGGPMRVMIATSLFLLGTLAVIYGGSSSSNSNNRAVGLSDALLLRQKNQAAKLYAPGTSDVCFADKRNTGKYCWYINSSTPYPAEQWEIAPTPHGNNNCGQMCTEFAACGGPCGDQHTDDQPTPQQQMQAYNGPGASYLRR